MNTKAQPKTKICLSCQKEISFNISKCPYCGKDFRSWFKRHPILTAIIGFFIFSNILGSLPPLFSSRKTPSSKDSVINTNPPPLLQSNKKIKSIFNIKMVKGKTISELEQILGKPSSHIKPSGEIYGFIKWEKGEVIFTTQYLDRADVPQAFDFQFSDINLSFSQDDFNEAFRLIGIELTKNQFKNTPPSGLPRHTAKNLAGFKQIDLQSTIEDKAYIKSIMFIQSCEPLPLCE